MNKDVLEGKWKQIRGEAKAWWGKLTDDDLDRAAGKLDVLTGLLQEKLSTAAGKYAGAFTEKPKKIVAYRFYEIVLRRPDTFALKEFFIMEEKRKRYATESISARLAKTIGEWEAFQSGGSLAWPVHDEDDSKFVNHLAKAMESARRTFEKQAYLFPIKNDSFSQETWNMLDEAALRYFLCAVLRSFTYG